MNKRKLLAALMTAFVMMNVYSAKAQETFEFKPSVNVSYGINQIHSTKFETIAPTGLIAIDADLFEIFPRLSGGFHLGFGLMGYTNSAMEDTGADVKNTLGIHYGFDLHYTVFNSKNWNIQVGATMGSIASIACIPIAEYGLTSTVKFFPVEKLGVFVEAGWGNYYFSKKYFDHLGVGNANLKAGISYRL